MQTVGELWLVLSLTGNPLAVGVTTALQFTPMLLFGAWGGVIADRLDKRRLLIFTQTAMALPALMLWGLASSGAVKPWMIFTLVFARGAVNAIDNPARQAFLVELVSSARLVNAVGLNSALVQVARVAGPALAGLTIATVGVADCFLINAASFAAMIAALRRMDTRALHTSERTPRAKGQLRVRPSMRGRVMALYSVVFLGSNPIGGPLMGWISGAAGPRAGLLLGAGAAIAGGLVARVAFTRMPDTNTGEHRAVQLHPDEVRRRGATRGRAPAGTRRVGTAGRGSRRGSAAVEAGAAAERRPPTPPG